MTSPSNLSLRRPRVPRVLRAAGPLLLGLLLLTGCLSSSQSTGLSLLNDDRRAAGVRSLPVQADAQAKAQAWADHLARYDSVSHSTLTDDIHVRWCSLGENVGVASSIAGLENAYMASSEHRANILSTSWNGVGVGVARNGTHVYVVQEFIRTC